MDLKKAVKKKVVKTTVTEDKVEKVAEGRSG